MDLVVLVACFSVLAALAIPRQLQLSGELRRAEVEALAASVDSAVRLVHAVWQAGERSATLRLSNGEVVMRHGYPSAATVVHTLEPAETAAFEFAGGRWRHRDGRRSESCGVSYAPPAAAGELPRIEVQRAGC